MISDETRVSLASLCSKIGSGATPRGGKEAYKESGIALIRSQNVLDFAFSEQGLAFIDEKQAAQLDNVAVQRGDVLINITGDSVARVCLAPEEYLPARVNQHVAIVRTKPEKADAKYIFYYLQLKKEHLLSLASSGATRNALTKKMLEDLEVPKLSLSEQKNISNILSALDDKIAENNKINHHLEQMTQAIFKSWLVDFEPFGGVMSADCHEVPLGEVVEIRTKSLSPQKHPNTVLEHYSIPAFDENRLPVFESASKVKSNKYILDKECFLISKLNPSTKRIWRPYCITEHAVCSTEFIVYRAKNPSHKDFYYSIVDSPSFTDFLLAHVTGSTGSRQRAIPSDTLSFSVTMPPDEIITDFCDNVKGIYARIEQNHLECSQLRQMRDLLLPRLISGEISVAALTTK